MAKGAVKLVRPFLSVIIVTYNSRDFIGECLKSVERAIEKVKGRDWELETGKGLGVEIIVVDNASTDGTAEIVRQFKGVRLICNTQNLGFAAGINRGAKVAQGDWLLLLNPDCVVDENALSTLADFVQNCGDEVAIVGLQLLNADGTLQPSGRRFPKVWGFILALLGFSRWMEARWFKGRDFTKVQEVDEVSGAALAISRNAFEQVGGMDEGFFLFFEELDLCRRVKAKGLKVVYLPGAKVRHHWGASVKRVPEIARRAQQQSAIRYFRKHHGLIASTLVSIAFALRNFAHKTRYRLCSSLTIQNSSTD
jgi:GT2 family glycosyltransferase